MSIRCVITLLFCCLTVTLHADSSLMTNLQHRLDEILANGNVVLNTNTAQKEKELKYSRPDTHAPAHLMGAHLHSPSERMIEYKYMNMSMTGLFEGETQLTNMEVLNNYPSTMVVPERMSMEMHMLHYMAGWTDDINVYIMPMWLSNTMEMTPYMDNGMGMKMPMPTQTRQNSGFGDLPFGALWRLRSDDDQSTELIMNIGFSAPTGDIDGKTTSPMNPMMQIEYPYPMRLGAGTWMARPGITWNKYNEDSSVGLQLQTNIALGKSDAGYAPSDIYRLNGWYSKLFSEDRTWAYTLRMEGVWASDFQGQDPQLEMMQMGAPPMTIAQMNPAANGAFKGGQFINFGYGVIKSLKDGSRLNFELAHPVHQDFRGLQMGTDWTISASWSKSY